MPSPAELIGRLVTFVGDVLGASSLRFDIVPTLIALGVLLVLLQLVARPISRWVSADAGGLTAIGRSMALAAEAGTDVVVSLGNAGITRATDALSRLQTLAALPSLAHVVRASARSGVPLRVLVNDPLAAIVARATVDESHLATETPERSRRSRVVFVSEGRLAPAGLALAARARPAAAVGIGSYREEAMLHLEGLRHRAGALTAGTAEPSQPPSVILAGGWLIGPDLYQAPADLRADVTERTMVKAGNRLIGFAVVIIVAGAVLSAAGLLDDPTVLLGTIGE